MTLDTRIVRSSCRGCHGVCQVLVHLEGNRITPILGDPESPTSRGFICPKGAASAEMLYHPDRIQYPLRRAGARGENRWERVSWEEALSGSPALPSKMSLSINLGSPTRKKRALVQVSHCRSDGKLQRCFQLQKIILDCWFSLKQTCVGYSRVIRYINTPCLVEYRAISRLKPLCG